MNNIRDIENKTVHRNKRNQSLQTDYSFTDDALEDLIASVEAEGMLHPPKGFHDDVISRIRRKRKYKKNLQLFSYSMKVITATAAAVGIVLIVPDNISTQESNIFGFVSEWQESDGTDKQKTSQNEKAAEEEKKAQEKIQKEIQKKSQKEEARREREKNQYAQEKEKLQNGNFIHRVNRQMDGYVDIVNEKLNQFIRMEVNINEKEEK
ncbi:MAG: hypothetical protein HDR03_16255 [Lachnospiraceae bacterium]|nr:hypothetical protein [Lachnospiraceae bacterium]